MATATALVRRKGVLALALSCPLATSAFTSSLHRVPMPSRIICRSKTTSVSGDDPTLSNGNDFEWLKKSRPMRIHGRLLPTNGDSASTRDPSSVTKVVHFQRHGQGTHNQLYKEWTEKTGKPLDLTETDPTKNPLLLDHITDAPLTQKGRNQCMEQRDTASALDGVELVIVSPLVRALQTAHITFEDHLPNNSQRDVKWIVHEDVREELGLLLCNKRRPLSETKADFPYVDYKHMPHGEHDMMWNNHVKKSSDEKGIPKPETTEDMSHRAYDFLVNFLHKRQEKEIAVVGHSAWLLAMTGAVLDLRDDEDVINTMFGQAELRSMELVFSEQ